MRISVSACLLFFLVLSLIHSQPVSAGAIREQIGPNTYHTYWVDNPEPQMKIKWRERTSTRKTRGKKKVRKEILLSTVCYNYESGSLDYRACRQDAREHFREKCEEYRGKYRKTKYPYNKRYKADMDKFCRAGALFRP